MLVRRLKAVVCGLKYQCTYKVFPNLMEPVLGPLTRLVPCLKQISNKWIHLHLRRGRACIALLLLVSPQVSIVATDICYLAIAIVLVAAVATSAVGFLLLLLFCSGLFRHLIHRKAPVWSLACGFNDPLSWGCAAYSGFRMPSPTTGK